MNIPFETREVNLKNKPQSFLEYSPKGTVPVLVLPSGQVLEESLDIIFYAMPKPSATFAQEIKLIQINDTAFKVNVTGYKYLERANGGLTQEQYRVQCEEFLSLLEAKLHTNTYLFDSVPSIADIAIFPLVRQFSRVDLDWFERAPYPNVKRWLGLISASPFFEKAMRKHPFWSD